MDLTLMAANQVGVNIIRDITDAEIASIKAKGEIQRSKMRMAHLDEMERLKAEGERLKAEREAIEERNEKAKIHKTSREYYMNRRDTYPLSRKRFGQAVLIKNKLDKKIKKQVSGYIFRKSLNNTPYEIPEVKFEPMAITNMLLNKKPNNQPE